MGVSPNNTTTVTTTNKTTQLFKHTKTDYLERLLVLFLNRDGSKQLKQQQKLLHQNNQYECIYILYTSTKTKLLINKQ